MVKATNSAKIFSVILILEFLNYLLTTSAFNSFTTIIDVVLSLFLVATEIFLVKRPQISKYSVLLIALFILKIIFTSDIVASLLRISSLIVQILFVYEVLSFELRQTSLTTYKQFVDKTWNFFSKVTFILCVINTGIMILGKYTGTFTFLNIDIGNYISGRYFGFLKTPAFCSELAFLNLIFSFYKGKKIKKMISFVLVGATYYLSGARTLLVATAFFVFMYLLLSQRRYAKLKAQLFFTFFGIVVVLLLIFVGESVLDIISSGRINIWENVIRNSVSVKNVLGSSTLDFAIELDSEVYEGGAHNSFIQLIYNLGLLISFIVIGYLCKNIVRFGKSIFKCQSDFLIICFCGCLSIIVFCFFEAHLFLLRTSLSFTFWYLLLIGNTYKVPLVIQVGEGESI